MRTGILGKGRKSASRSGPNLRQVASRSRSTRHSCADDRRRSDTSTRVRTPAGSCGS
jgi:hypothetical protein